jgi:hypothetical protein
MKTITDEFLVVNALEFQDIDEYLRRQFLVFHAENPHVYALFKKFALQVKGSGYKRYGISALTARIRWHMNIETKTKDFKINDHHDSCYARLLMLREPELKGFFETRVCRKG